MDLLRSISDSIFVGYKLVVPLLIIQHLFHLFPFQVSWKTLLVSVNTVYLIGSILFLGVFAQEVFIAWYSAAEYESYALLSTKGVLTYFLWGSYLLTYLLLPNLMWIKTMRQSLFVAATIVGVGFSTSMLISLLAKENDSTTFDWIDSLIKISVFTSMVVCIYLLKSKTSNEGT